jgi:hypothetical protein
LWKLVRRVPLLVRRNGTLLGFRLDVGPAYIAVSDAAALRSVVSRADLSLQWQGCVQGSALAWLDATRLLIRLGQQWRSVGIWDVSAAKVTWKASGDGRCWGTKVAVVTRAGELQVREAASGRVCGGAMLEPGTIQSLLVVGDVLLREVNGRLSGLALPTGRTLWMISAQEVFSGLPLGEKSYWTLLPAGEGEALVRYDTNYSLLDAQTGRWRWRRSVPTKHLPCIAEDHIGFLFAGSILVLNRANGKPLIQRDHAVQTLWESRPSLHDNRLVVVDEGGHIATIDMYSGEVDGIQHERGAHFADCVNVDGRLLVSDLDGAVWIYERSGKATGATPDRSKSIGLAANEQPDRVRPRVRVPRGKTSGPARSTSKAKRR